MSDWHCEIVYVDQVQKHENADALDVVMVYGTTPCIVRRGQFKAGDRAVYVPIDSVLPDRPEFAFLKPNERAKLKAKRLRGVFSMGLLIDVPPELDSVPTGEDVADALGITKYEPPEPGLGGGRVRGEAEGSEPEPKHFRFPKYTDIEGYRRHSRVLEDGEPVVITEKIHGSSFRAAHDGERLWIGSRRVVWKPDADVAFSRLAAKYDLAGKLSAKPFLVVYGELYGSGVQDLTYGAKSHELTLFDAYDAKAQRWLNHDELCEAAADLGLSTVPILYSGPWSTSLLSLAEGESTMGGHVREGFVVKPLTERFHPRLPDCRVILKHVGEGYLTRKAA